MRDGAQRGAEVRRARALGVAAEQPEVLDAAVLDRARRKALPRGERILLDVLEVSLAEVHLREGRGVSD